MCTESMCCLPCENEREMQWMKKRFWIGQKIWAKGAGMSFKQAAIIRFYENNFSACFSCFPSSAVCVRKAHTLPFNLFCENARDKNLIMVEIIWRVLKMADVNILSNLLDENYHKINFAWSIFCFST